MKRKDINWGFIFLASIPGIITLVGVYMTFTSSSSTGFVTTAYGHGGPQTVTGPEVFFMGLFLSFFFYVIPFLSYIWKYLTRR